MPFNELQPGIYTVSENPPDDLCPDIDFGCPIFTEVFHEYNDDVIHAATAEDLEPYQQLPNAEAVMVVEDWQTDLRKVTMRITWDDVESGERTTYEKHVFIHADTGSE